MLIEEASLARQRALQAEVHSLAISVDSALKARGYREWIAKYG
jgi:hypothetical protein